MFTDVKTSINELNFANIISSEMPKHGPFF